MGAPPFKKTCRTGYAQPPAPAPNPRSDRWTLLDTAAFPCGYVLKVRYHDCTNFEGVKIMVYRGKYAPPRYHLDPHFHEGKDAPIARFRPDSEGWKLACILASSLQ